MASFSLAKIPWYGQLALFVAVSLGLAGAFYYLQETTAQVELKKKNTELTAVKARLAKGNATARQLPEFRQQVGELEARLDSLKPILPDEKDAGDLLRRIQQLATQSNLQIRGFRPQAITQREMHAEWPISLQLEGSYHNLGLWLDRVSKFPRIINIGNLTLTQKDPPVGNVSMDISCTATTFVLVDRPAETDTKKKVVKKAPAPPAK
ncbi:MAG: type 4a pilus biogenesis protein PilO [Vicinamibacterales bacterium]